MQHILKVSASEQSEIHPTIKTKQSEKTNKSETSETYDFQYPVSFLCVLVTKPKEPNKHIGNRSYYKLQFCLSYYSCFVFFFFQFPPSFILTDFGGSDIPKTDSQYI